MERIYCAMSILVLCANKINGQNILGKTTFNLQKSERCPDTPEVIKFVVSTRPLDRTSFGISITFNTPYDFDDNVGIELAVSQKQNNDYKPGAYAYKDSNACTSLEKLMGREWFDDFTNALGIEDKGCPIVAGNYSMKDYVIDEEKLNQAYIYGEMLVQMKFLLADEVKACILVHVELAPRNKLY